MDLNTLHQIKSLEGKIKSFRNLEDLLKTCGSLRVLRVCLDGHLRSLKVCFNTQKVRLKKKVYV